MTFTVATQLGISTTFTFRTFLFGFRYWDNGGWELVKGEEIFYVNPLDGEVFANIVNMSTGFHVRKKFLLI